MEQRIESVSGSIAPLQLSVIYLFLSLASKSSCNAGQIFREAAQGLINSKKIAIGSFMRKIRSKKGAPVAIKAGARKIAMAYYNLITKGHEYVEMGIKQYEAKLKDREIRLLSILAIKHNISLTINTV